MTAARRPPWESSTATAAARPIRAAVDQPAHRADAPEALVTSPTAPLVGSLDGTTDAAAAPIDPDAPLITWRWQQRAGERARAERSATLAVDRWAPPSLDCRPHDHVRVGLSYLRTADDTADDALLERVWVCAATTEDAAAVQLLLEGIGAAPAPEAQIARLTARAAAHHQALAAALAADPQQIPNAALRLRELSALRYGVDPILSAEHSPRPAQLGPALVAAPAQSALAQRRHPAPRPRPAGPGLARGATRPAQRRQTAAGMGRRPAHPARGHGQLRPSPDRSADH